MRHGLLLVFGLLFVNSIAKADLLPPPGGGGSHLPPTLKCKLTGPLSGGAWLPTVNGFLKNPGFPFKSSSAPSFHTVGIGNAKRLRVCATFVR